MDGRRLYLPDSAVTAMSAELMLAPWGLIATRPGVTAMRVGEMFSPCIEQHNKLM